MLNQSATFTVKKPIDKIKSFFNDRFSISVFLVVLFSNLLGSLLVGSKSAFFFNMADKLFSSFYNLISSGNFFRVFLCSFFILAAFYLFEYFLSNGVFGFIFIYLFAFGIGLLHGLAAGFAYNNFGLQGITINVILIVPFFIFNYLFIGYFGFCPARCLSAVIFFNISTSTSLYGV